MILSRNFFYKIDAWISYLGDASVKNHLPLHAKKQTRHLNSELEIIKAYGEGGNSFSQRHFIAETTSPVRSVNKEQEQAVHSSS